MPPPRPMRLSAGPTVRALRIGTPFGAFRVRLASLLAANAAVGALAAAALAWAAAPGEVPWWHGFAASALRSSLELLTAPLAVAAAIMLHELAHAAVACLFGGTIDEVVVGGGEPFLQVGRVSCGPSLTRGHVLVTTPEPQRGVPLLLILAAGPLANLAAAAALAALPLTPFVLATANAYFFLMALKPRDKRSDLGRFLLTARTMLRVRRRRAAANSHLTESARCG